MDVWLCLAPRGMVGDAFRDMRALLRTDGFSRRREHRLECLTAHNCGWVNYKNRCNAENTCAMDLRIFQALNALTRDSR